MNRRTRVGLVFAVVMSASATCALAVPPPASRTFGGTTSQHIPDNSVSLKTDENGHVSKFSLAWRAPCKKKGVYWTANTTVKGGSKGLAMRGDVFHANGSYKSNAGHHVTGTVTISMQGSFSDEDHAAGTWKPKVVVYKSGQKIDKCKSPAIDWKVSPLE